MTIIGENNELSKTLDTLIVQHQKQNNWCWAAVATGVDHFYEPDSPSTQCSVASAQDNAGACCSDPSTGNCDRRWFLEKALLTVHRLQEGPVPGRLSFDDLVACISAQSPKPVCARIGWEGDGGHFVAIKGFQNDAAQTLLIADPIDGDCKVPYDIFVKSYHGFGSWTHYYLTDEVNHVDHV